MYDFKINERLQELRNFMHMTRDEFAQKTQIGTTTLNNLENKKQKINGEHLELLCESFPEFAYWIATGRTLPEAGQISPEIAAVKKHLRNGAA